MKGNLFDGFGMDRAFSQLYNDRPRLIDVGGGNMVPTMSLAMLISQTGLTRNDVEEILGKRIPDNNELMNEDKQTLLIELTKRLS